MELGKPFSLHSVQAQDQTIKFLDECKKRYGEERWDNVRFDLHSFGGSGDTAKRIVKSEPPPSPSIKNLRCTQITHRP